ncbi:uncharacterized protein LOC132903239 [Amyelois transitella]|uniref:uncharacterized protein LOC132903239 n=1 Tax=Amyelois transitella TaxID=680683 RepID=UPI00298F5513|nr:uncharacterized protein LOC132903239 [Amyelois transitella]
MILPKCEDFIGCLPPRMTALLISVISLVGCIADDMISSRAPSPHCTPAGERVQSARHVIVTLFQIANLLLLLACIVESACLVNIYVAVTLGFVGLGLIVALMEFLVKSKEEGPLKSLVLFVPEVLFLFMIFRCIPLVDRYRGQLNMHMVSAELKASQYRQAITGEYAGVKL